MVITNVFMFRLESTPNDVLTTVFANGVYRFIELNHVAWMHLVYVTETYIIVDRQSSPCAM